MDDVIWVCVGVIVLFCVIGNIVAFWAGYDRLIKSLFDKDKQL